MTPEDIHSATWMRIKAELTSRIEKLRTSLEKNHDPEATALNRGELRGIRRTIQMVEGKKEQQPVLDDDGPIY